MAHLITLREYLNTKREQDKSAAHEHTFFRDYDKRPQLQYLKVVCCEHTATVIYWCEGIINFDCCETMFRYHYTVLYDTNYWKKGIYDYWCRIGETEFAKYITEFVQCDIAVNLLTIPKTKLPTINIFE